MLVITEQTAPLRSAVSRLVNNTIKIDKASGMASAEKPWKIAGKIALALTGIALAAPIIAANVSWILSGFESSPTSSKDHGVFLLYYFYTLPPAVLLGALATICFFVAWTKNKP